MEPVTLPVRELKKLEEQNQARFKLGLPIIQVKQRQCLTCRRVFVSIGNRCCKACGTQKGSTLQPRDVF